MPRPANWGAFQGAALEANRREALGYQADGSIAGGMMTATVTEIPVGVWLSRIAHTGTPVQVTLSAPWWTYLGEFSAAVRDPLGAAAAVSHLARNQLALSSDYIYPREATDELRASFGLDPLASLHNDAERKPYDRIYIVEATRTLLAFRGKGRPVADRPRLDSDREGPTWNAGRDIDQLFIPGLRDPGAKLSAIGRSALHFHRSMSVAGWLERLALDRGSQFDL